MNVNGLPESCLQVIFGKLPPADLTSVGRVCTKWRSILPLVTSKFTSLALVVGKVTKRENLQSKFESFPNSGLVWNDDRTLMYPSQVKYTKWNTIKCTKMGRSTAQQLAQTFTNLTTVEIFCLRMPEASFATVLFLLEQWHSKLVTIRLQCSFIEMENNQLGDDATKKLLSVLNRTPSPLKNLTLEFNCSIMRLSDYGIGFDLSIAAQLEQLYLSSKDEYDLMNHLLEKFALANTELRKIGYFSEDLNPFKEYVRSMPVEICSRFTHLGSTSMFGGSIDISLMPKVCARFTSLTQIHFSPLTNFTMARYRKSLSHLAKLPELVHLRMEIWFNCFEPEKGGRQQRRQQPLPQLNSVKTLKLETRYLTKHDDLALFNIGQIFPSVQVIALDNMFNDCSICGYNDNMTHEELSADYKPNICAMFLLSHCVNGSERVRRVSINGRDIFADDASGAWA